MLTPAQQRVTDGLLDQDGARPTFDELLPLRLLDILEDGLGPLVEDLGPGDMAVNKGALAKVLQCERHFVEEHESRFEWSVPTARGVIAHRALQLSVTMRDAAPLDLVDEAIERITEDGDDWTPRDFLRAARPGVLAELRDDANDLVSKFQESFPPLVPALRPRLESSLRVEVCGGRIVLRAKVDLAVDRPVGNEARTIIVDFKSGGPHASHVDDLRYYALVETIRLGVPPFRIAAFYLDAARWHHEDITEELLVVAARRTVGAVTKIASMRYGEGEPAESPGPACSYCRVKSTCSAFAALPASH